MVENMGIEDIKKKVLVTGGGGFIGSRLVKTLLRKGLTVKVLNIHQGLLKEESSPNLEFIGVGSAELRGGMVDKGLVEQAVKDVDVIYHLAINWGGATWLEMHPLADLFDANVRGTLNLLEAAKSYE
jgi:UDP-glucose 4-epimerase